MIKLNEHFNAGTAVTIMLLLILFLVIFGPLLVIWSLNTLFGLAIEYSLTTWAAVVILNAFISTAISARSKGQ